MLKTDAKGLHAVALARSNALVLITGCEYPLVLMMLGFLYGSDYFEVSPSKEVLFPSCVDGLR